MGVLLMGGQHSTGAVRRYGGVFSSDDGSRVFRLLIVSQGVELLYTVIYCL